MKVGLEQVSGGIGSSRGARILLTVAVLVAMPATALAQTRTDSMSPGVLIITMAALALMPFALIMTTSFVKVAVVLSIARNALGTQQIPPNQVITGLAIMLTVFIMTPVAIDCYDAAGGSLPDQQSSMRQIFDAAQRGKEPVRAFLMKHAQPKEVALFVELAGELDPKRANLLRNSDFQVLIPAFVISELKEAFLIGFFIFLPFLVVDIIVSNILLALGMHMLSPLAISLPFKLLVFIAADGWVLIVSGLVRGYV